MFFWSRYGEWFFYNLKNPFVGFASPFFLRQVAKIRQKIKIIGMHAGQHSSPPTTSLNEGCIRMVIMGNNWFSFLFWAQNIRL
jgi:hypothetical protein